MPNVWHFKLPTFGLIFVICVRLHHLYWVWAHTEHSSTSGYIFPCFWEFVHIWLLCTDIISNEITPRWSTLRKLRPELLYLQVSFSVQVQATSVDILYFSKECKNTNSYLIRKQRNCAFLKLAGALVYWEIFKIVLQDFTQNYED